MARPPLQLGTHGEIRFHPHGDRVRAVTSYRGHDGKTRQVERVDDTEKKAAKKLRDALRNPDAKSPLSAASRFRDAAEAWITHVKSRRQATSIENYRRALNNRVLDHIGDLRLNEIDLPTLENFFDELAEEGFSANYRRSIRTVVRGPLSLATRRGLIKANPIHDLSPIEGKKRKVRALTPEERVDLLAKLDKVCGESYFRDATLPSIVRFMLGTGVRIGEAIAVRWRDVNLTDQPVTLTDGTKIPAKSVSINGNIVAVTGEGLRRHEGKTENSVRMLALPGFLVTLLTVSRPAEASEDTPIFPSEVMGWKYPNNVGRSWRRVRHEIGYDWVTTHVFRKTAATILDDQNLTARQIADQLGHAQPSMTQNVYMGRGSTNPDAAAALNQAYSPM